MKKVRSLRAHRAPGYGQAEEEEETKTSNIRTKKGHRQSPVGVSLNFHQQAIPRHSSATEASGEGLEETAKEGHQEGEGSRVPCYLAGASGLQQLQIPGAV